MLHGIVKKLFDPRIRLKITFNILRRFFSRDTQVLTQSKRTDPVNNSKVDCLGISSLQICHLVKRSLKHLRRCHSVNILCLPVCLDQMCVSGTMRQYTQLNLRIIRINKYIAFLRHKYFPDQPSQFHSYRNILQIRFCTADPPGRGNRLIKRSVNPSIRSDIICQSVRIRGF